LPIAQHCWPGDPQAPQVPSVVAVPPPQTVSAALQALPAEMQCDVPGSQQLGTAHSVPVAAQHGAFVIPHAVQVVPLQIVAAARHADPAPTQLPLVSQHPPVHALPAQQTSPGLPHVVHAPLAHTVCAAVHASPVATQVDDAPSQQPPLAHAAPVVQHEAPTAPQAQVPFTHV
jgi:hypothetical protein